MASAAKPPADVALAELFSDGRPPPPHAARAAQAQYAARAKPEFERVAKVSGQVVSIGLRRVPGVFVI